MHTVTNESRKDAIEEAVGDMVRALVEMLDMSPPSAVFAIQQITARQLAYWDKAATVKNLRATARFIASDISHKQLDKEQAKLFDQIAAAFEREVGTTVN